MKRIFFSSVFFLFNSWLSYGQTVLYNGGTDITASAGAIIYVDGDIVNDHNGNIHNQGDIHFTKDWTNNEVAGCLDPTTGTVFLDGGTQFIKGSQTTQFNNLNCFGSGIKTLNITTIVGGNTGSLALNSDPFNLNGKTLVVTNPLPSGITRTSGYIISETDPSVGYGTIDWVIGNSISGSNYIYPFGTISGTYVPFLFSLTAAGVQSALGSVAVATYPTNVTANPNNLPLPTGVSNLQDDEGKESASSCLDRYWIINSNNYSTNPVADITFTYRDLEWDRTGGSTNNFASEGTLFGWMWNGTQWKSITMETLDTIANTLRITSMQGSAPWTLKGKELICENFFIPNAFSPNGDSKNDFFRPRNNCIKTLDFRIYNRWGNLVYESTSPADKGWDGSTPQGKDGNEGIYAYELNATLLNGNKIVKSGMVNLLK